MKIDIRYSFPLTFYKKVESVKNAKFVCESCLKTEKGGWANFAAAFFYQREPHENGSHYFALYQNAWSGDLIIANGQVIEEQEITGILAENGEIIYSRYRHDYVDSYDRSVSIDGGRDYVRTTGKGRTVPLVVRQGVLFVKPDQSNF